MRPDSFGVLDVGEAAAQASDACRASGERVGVCGAAFFRFGLLALSAPMGMCPAATRSECTTGPRATRETEDTDEEEAADAAHATGAAAGAREGATEEAGAEAEAEAEAGAANEAAIGRCC